jgi:hypothetical protein
MSLSVGSFDLILCHHTLHHFGRATGAALDKIRSVLVSGEHAWFRSGVRLRPTQGMS